MLQRKKKLQLQVLQEILRQIKRRKKEKEKSTLIQERLIQTLIQILAQADALQELSIERAIQNQLIAEPTEETHLLLEIILRDQKQSLPKKKYKIKLKQPLQD